MKRYQLSYYLDEDKTNVITISWEQGLQNVKAYYNKELFYESKTMAPLNKGESIYHEKLGNVFIRFCSRPIGFEVKVGDVYLENSRILAQEALVTVAAIWMFIGILSTLGTIGFALMDGVWYSTFGIALVFTFFAVSIFYIVSGVLIRKGQIWAYYTAVGIFGAITLLYFGNLVSINIPLVSINIPIIVFRGIVIFIVLRHFKDMRDLYRHYKAKGSRKALKNQEALLDL